MNSEFAITTTATTARVASRRPECSKPQRVSPTSPCRLVLWLAIAGVTWRRADAPAARRSSLIGATGTSAPGARTRPCGRSPMQLTGFCPVPGSNRHQITIHRNPRNVVVSSLCSCVPSANPMTSIVPTRAHEWKNGGSRSPENACTGAVRVGGVAGAWSSVPDSAKAIHN